MRKFDVYSEQYDAALRRGLWVSGESKEYFAKARVEFLANLFEQMRFTPRLVVDFGCGVGSSVPYLLRILGAEKVIGLDVSRKSLEVARRAHSGLAASYRLVDEYAPEGIADAVFCSGVFHHIPLGCRREAIRYVSACLRSGGFLALWENNPWNPGTRFVMSRIPFDRGAVMLSPPEATRLVRSPRDMRVMRIDYLFFFPSYLRFVRWLEPRLSRLPLGAQYQVLARKCRV